MNHPGVERPQQSRKHLFTLAVGALSLLAIFTRFYHLGHECVWLDEAITFHRSALPVDELVESAVRRFHNPTYFLLIHYVMRFGDDEFWLRAPSALFGLMKLVVVYRIGRLVHGRAVGLLSVLVLILSRYQVHYDQEARMYAPLGFAAAIALFGLLWIVENPSATADAFRRTTLNGHERPSQQRHAVLALGAFGLGLLLCLYLHNTATLLALTCGVVALFVVTQNPSNWRSLGVRFSFTAAAVILLFAPWVPTLLNQTSDIADKGWPATAPNLLDVVKRLRDLFLLGSGSVPFSLAILALAVYGSIALRKRKTLLVSLWVLSGMGPVLLGLISISQPMFYIRFVLWAAIPFSVLVAVGIASLRPRALLAVAVVGLLAFGSFDLWKGYYQTVRNPRWADAALALSWDADPNTVVLSVGRHETIPLSYYFQRKTNPLQSVVVLDDVRAMQEELQPFIQGKDTILVVNSRRLPEAEVVRQQLRLVATRTWRRKYGPRLVIERFERRLNVLP